MKYIRLFIALVTMFLLIDCRGGLPIKNTSLSNDLYKPIAKEAVEDIDDTQKSESKILETGRFKKGEVELNMLIEPYESLGLLETEAIRQEEITVVGGIFPDILFGEYFPGRIRWNGWVVDEDEKEYFAQMIFGGIGYSGYFEVFFIIDGQPSDQARIVDLSSSINYVYDLIGDETQVYRKKFLDNTEDYRKKIVLKKGTRLGDMKNIPKDDFLRMLKSWNRFQTPEGIILSPISEENLKFVAGINPQYSFQEKLMAVGRFSISVTLDPVAIAMGLAIDIFRAYKAPSVGWDYNSQIPNRRQMAIIIKYVLDLKQKLIDKINSANAEIILERGWRK